MDFTLPDFDLNHSTNLLNTLENKINEASLAKEHHKLGDLYNEYNGLKLKISNFEQIKNKITEYEETKLLLEDSELAAFAEEELSRLLLEIPKMLEDFNKANLPVLPDDNASAIIEIRAGTGGVEASLFAEEVGRMYTRYLAQIGLTTESISTNYNDEGGIKEFVFSVNKAGSYGLLRFESGVHRVQRVPSTESAGRIHTSAISIVVLPEIEAKNVEIDPLEIKIDVYRASGPGGQSVNTTDSAVRITHIPTGIVVTCQDGKSQHKNKDKAMGILASKLKLMQLEKEASSSQALRQQSILSGDRSAKIRTYNFPQGRITDHRIKQTWYKLIPAMEGDIDEIVKTVNTKLRENPDQLSTAETDDDE